MLLNEDKAAFLFPGSKCRAAIGWGTSSRFPTLEAAWRESTMFKGSVRPFFCWRWQKAILDVYAIWQAAVLWGQLKLVLGYGDRFGARWATISRAGVTAFLWLLGRLRCKTFESWAAAPPATNGHEAGGGWDGNQQTVERSRATEQRPMPIRQLSTLRWSSQSSRARPIWIEWAQW